MGKRAHRSWSYEAQPYLLLNRNVSWKDFAGKISGFLILHDERTNPKVVPHIQPLSRIHLYSLNGTDPIVFIYIFFSDRRRCPYHRLCQFHQSLRDHIDMQIPTRIHSITDSIRGPNNVETRQHIFLSDRLGAAMVMCSYKGGIKKMLSSVLEASGGKPPSDFKLRARDFRRTLF